MRLLPNLATRALQVRFFSACARSSYRDCTRGGHQEITRNLRRQLPGNATRHCLAITASTACRPGPLQATSHVLTFSSFGILLVSLGIGYSVLQYIQPATITTPELPEFTSERPSMPGEVAPGRPGNLTPEQEEKLRRLWQLLFRVFGLDAEEADSLGPAPSSVSGKLTEDDAKKPKKKRMSIFSRKGKKESGTEPDGAAPHRNIIATRDGDEDKYGQTKHFYDTLASQSPESIRETVWAMVKHDHPDALVLRFLRARKWDIEKALVMLVSTMNWRHKDMHVDDDIMKNGEAAALEAEQGVDPTAKKLGHDFLAQIRMGKSFVHGTDKEGRPICLVRVRLHKQGEQAEESLERYTVYLIETCRYLLQPPVDTATIVFDMTGFTMANMDYTPVKFMIKCFEANYPESLGAVLVHKAPWIFQGIWKIIRGWLDPVVANKVHFTNNLKEIEEFIPRNQVLKELDGEEDWEYKYVEPVPGENAKMSDMATRDRMLAARDLLVKEFERVTMEWIQSPEGDAAAELKGQRDALATRLRDDYWNIDPYLRARSYYDRTGVLQPGGALQFYPPVKPEKSNGLAAPPAETSADDVD